MDRSISLFALFVLACGGAPAAQSTVVQPADLGPAASPPPSAPSLPAVAVPEAALSASPEVRAAWLEIEALARDRIEDHAIETGACDTVYPAWHERTEAHLAVVREARRPPEGTV